MYNFVFFKATSEISMYAVVRTGGKQYRVSAGEKLRIEKVGAAVGSEVVLEEVLLVGDGQALKVGTPVVKGASVKAKIVAHGLGEKVMIFKLRRRKNSKRLRGHRQAYTEIEVTGIAGPLDRCPGRERRTLAPKKTRGSSRHGRGSQTEQRGVHP